MGGCIVLWVVVRGFSMFWAFRRREGVVMELMNIYNGLLVAGWGSLGLVGDGWEWLGVVGGDITV